MNASLDSVDVGGDTLESLPDSAGRGEKSNEDCWECVRRASSFVSEYGRGGIVDCWLCDALGRPTERNDVCSGCENSEKRRCALPAIAPYSYAVEGPENERGMECGRREEGEKAASL